MGVATQGDQLGTQVCSIDRLAKGAALKCQNLITADHQRVGVTAGHAFGLHFSQGIGQIPGVGRLRLRGQRVRRPRPPGRGASRWSARHCAEARRGPATTRQAGSGAWDQPVDSPALFRWPAEAKRGAWLPIGDRPSALSSHTGIHAQAQNPCGRAVDKWLLRNHAENHPQEASRDSCINTLMIINFP